MNSSTPETPISIWEMLSIDAKKLSIFLGSPITATSQGMELLSSMAQGEFELEPALKELQQFGVLEQVTFLQELDEIVNGPNATPPPDKWFLKPDYTLSPEEKAYLRAKESLERAANNPQAKEQWSKPRFRLTKEYKKFMGDLHDKYSK